MGKVEDSIAAAKAAIAGMNKQPTVKANVKEKITKESEIRPEYPPWASAELKKFLRGELKYSDIPVAGPGANLYREIAKYNEWLRTQ